MACTDLLKPKYGIGQMAVCGCFLYIATIRHKVRLPEVHSVAHLGYTTLARRLEARREETLRDLRQRLQDAREEWTWTNDVRDTGESSELEGREGLELGLIRLKIDTLQRINQALARLRDGMYGRCIDCHGAISEMRLRALPFAVRCRECEEARERAEQCARAGAARERPPSAAEAFDSRPS